MGILGSIKNWSGDARRSLATRNEERKLKREQERAVSEREDNFVKQHNLRKTSTPGRYLLPGGDRVIDANPRSELSLGKAGMQLSKIETSPKVRKLTKAERAAAQKPSGFAGILDNVGEIGGNVNANLGPGGGLPGGANFADFGANMGSYDPFGFGAPAPKKKTRKKSAKKKSKKK
ncbi:hypothetical protein J2129_002768 [Methanofollis sp. W23]|uniref:hypothetical protein n=1 Tax=Methanofollis sp. W23 TaxID=2817849 RepID=UPI001AE661CB|nr:hypothetical protein [Methanofollis sp. W23]MBP2147255.1 hypothetical protein [Methanofollis sp. W23]